MTDKSGIYQAPERQNEIRLTVQGSRFIATLAPSTTEEEARKVIETVRLAWTDATHHTYAYRIATTPTGPGDVILERCSDDREPSGTAGLPILQVLQVMNLCDAVIVVTRYFGGTKLGIGGLTRAYRESARLAVSESTLISREPVTGYLVTVSYEDYGALTRLLEANEGHIIKVDYSDLVTVRVALPRRRQGEFVASLESATRGKAILIST